MIWGRGKPSSYKGSEPLSWSKIGEREKLGESAGGWDGTMSRGEEIPGVARGELTALTERVCKSVLCVCKSVLCLSKDRRPGGSR